MIFGKFANTLSASGDRVALPTAVIEEAKAGWPSAATADVRRPFTLVNLSKAEVRERMSGNLCRADREDPAYGQC